MTAMTALATIIEVLTPLPAEERSRIVHAALLMLGDPVPSARQRGEPSGSDEGLSNLPPRARSWINQNAITLDQLNQVFHSESGSIEIIASHLPGRNKKEQTHNAYVLAGIAQLLLNGVPTFEDKSARSYCEVAGCYDVANHSNTLKDKGNVLTGSKDKGWTLTAPGLKRGADLIKDMCKQKS